MRPTADGWNIADRHLDTAIYNFLQEETMPGLIHFQQSNHILWEGSPPKQTNQLFLEITTPFHRQAACHSFEYII